MLNNKKYRLIVQKNRSIEVIFAHIPNKRFSSGTRDKEQATLWAEEFLRNDGILSVEVPTLKEFSKGFFTRRDESSLFCRMKAFGKKNRDYWYYGMNNLLNNYVLPRFGSYPLDSITPIAIENWLISLKGIDKEHISNGTRCKVLNCIRYVLDDALRCGYINQNPARIINMPSETDSKGRRALTLKEQQTLFPEDPFERVSIWGSTMWASYFSVMYDTGFRPSEVAGLRVCDVYRTPNGMAIHTNHSINGELKKPISRVKTSGKGMEDRVGLLSKSSQTLITWLLFEDEIKNDNEYLFLIERDRKDSWVFCETANKHFKGVLKKQKIKIDGLTQYNIRHTYVSYRRGNVDENTLALSMGHKNGVRDDYDHRTATILIKQLEDSRDALFHTNEDSGIFPISVKIP